MSQPRAAATVVIQNRLGLHARPAMAFVDAAVACSCNVSLRRGDQTVDGKSIMQVMMLAATHGTELEIITEGVGAEEACAKLKALVEAKFGEE